MTVPYNPACASPCRTRIKRIGLVAACSPSGSKESTPVYPSRRHLMAETRAWPECTGPRLGGGHMALQEVEIGALALGRLAPLIGPERSKRFQTTAETAREALQ